jgi:hypothetical protein
MGKENMCDRSERKHYETPAVVFEKALEGLAAACGTGQDNLFLGDLNCKGDGQCEITYS